MNNETANETSEEKSLSLVDDAWKVLEDDNNVPHDSTQNEKKLPESKDTSTDNLEYHQVLEREEKRAIDSFLGTTHQVNKVVKILVL